jgi:7-keto-8-aminopelargonate synthetase-like enzyme
MAETDSFPADFADLAPFAHWARPTEYARMELRETSTLAELQAFYDAMIERLPAIVSYLNRFPVDAMPGDASRLLNLALMLTEASFAVERYRQPTVINGRERARFFPRGSEGS